eukprot:scaffold70946_cov18-Prasinocladus_malaysianus.AAC.1
MFVQYGLSNWALGLGTHVPLPSDQHCPTNGTSSKVECNVLMKAMCNVGNTSSPGRLQHTASL